ncbi:hypothetical protein SAMN05192534_12349 [Alteribacillus persepolensis]|uniref:Uncharacterized protein n=1 Tax=Alteribacillus persepolensis TaxID=568899 RepID=A0A1G8I8Y6_9BACI|nr:hypothetical protein [Alteribacillus persepolensis]SDI15449.1 hypothetical protein SAMN05192534_12349 [Alteribacillus persepolensis]
MGKPSRDKGQRREREFAELMNGEKVPQSGAAGGNFSNDVRALGLEWEVKAKKDGWKTIYKWLEDEREKPDALALKADRKDWLVVMKAEDFKKLMEGDE